ncbi:MAG TPA: methylmalonyl-CoA epimerase [Actinomycetota bacterium]|nr:methylmalonyl-CoA epimerase [Actinomycetota bacterium]
MLDKVEHIALAVSDLDASIELYHRAWGLEVEHREVVEDQGVEEAMLKVGDSYIQLLAPTSGESTVAKFIEKRGEGLHHIAYQVDNIDQALESLKQAGVQLIDESPRTGSRETKVAFVHPKGNGGVLVELVQLP